MAINAQTLSFFKLLSASDKAIFTCSIMRPDGGGVVSGYGCLFVEARELSDGTLENTVLNASSLCGPDSKGRYLPVTVHTTLNQTNLSGRRTGNIVSARVLCLDIDREMTADELEELKTKYVPHLIIESSPNRFHIYWKVSPTIPLARWQSFQLGLAWRFGGDKNAAALTAMMRVPGFERVTKTGELFVPRSVWKVSGGSAGELTEKGVLHKFQGIPDWEEKGLADQKAERKRMGELARAAWKAVAERQGEGAGRQHRAAEAGMRFEDLPDVGRNMAIYMAVKEESFQQELTLDAAQAFGGVLNSRFERPLDSWEVAKVVGSAWRKADDALARRRERHQEAVGMLGEGETVAADPPAAPDPPAADETDTAAAVIRDNPLTHLAQQLVPVPLDGGPVILQSPPPWLRQGSLGSRIAEVLDSGDANRAQAVEAVGKSNGCHGSNGTELPDNIITHLNFPDALVPALVAVSDSASQPEPPAAEPRLCLPKSIGLAGKRLGEILWEKDRERAIGMLAGGLTLKNYEGLADYVCEKWSEIGAFRKDGPVVFLEGRSRWGSAVHFGVGVERDNFILVVVKALHGLGVACRKSEGVGTAEERAKTEPLRKRLKNLPTQAQLGQIGKVVWAAACGWKPRKRQPGGVIVFQNGVFDLDSGRFSADVTAPLKYSHPVACRFDERTAEAVFRGADVDDIVPRFAGYMQDWFPGDTGIVKVLLRYFGYCMTTDYSRQMFAFFYGPTRAGKGSICRTMCALLGDANYYSADYEVLDKNFKSAGMHDKLLVSIEEAEGGEKEVERRMNYLKKLLGGEKVTFERKYAQPFDDNVIGKFVFQSNEPPKYQDKGHAIRARMICVGFERSFENAEAFVDPVMNVLEKEADALGTLMALAWARGRQENKCFAVIGSQALDVGQAEVGEAIDIVGSLVRKYCSYEFDAKVRSSTLKQAVELMAEERECALPSQINVRIKQEVCVHYPKCSYGRQRFENVSQRGYKNLKFNGEKFLEDYEELGKIGCETALRYLELRDEIRCDQMVTDEK